MNFKGLAWVGNVYHKVEAMCLELDELIVHDTAKYVESQVQAVGNSMKKFCSDVVQDFLPDDTVVQVTRPSIQRDSASLSMVHDARVRNEVGTVKPCDSPPGEVARLNSKEECQKEIRTENDHRLAVASSFMSQDSEIQPSISISLHAGSDDCRKETDEDSMQTSSSSVLVPGQLSEKSVEESCIIVDRDELHCVFPDRRKENDKRKPYKKILDAISSRMKQDRENEYKQLARQWYAEDVVNGRECGDKPKQIEEKRSSEESEWEIL